MMVAALVYATTYSENHRSLVSTWLISAPSSTTSEPARIGMCRSETAEVRVNRGSTWITRAPRARASSTHWKPTG